MVHRPRWSRRARGEGWWPIIRLIGLQGPLRRKDFNPRYSAEVRPFRAMRRRLTRRQTTRLTVTGLTFSLTLLRPRESRDAASLALFDCHRAERGPARTQRPDFHNYAVM